MQKTLSLLWTTALLALVQGRCDTNTLHFGDLDPALLSPYQLQLLSALGTYAMEPNSVQLAAYRHTGRPDIFLLGEPDASGSREWVIATLPDDKKPAKVKHAFEAWPDADSILASGEFSGDPWEAAEAEGWRVRDCDGRRVLLKNLTLSCVPRQFGQCATERWRVSGARSAELNGVFEKTGLAGGATTYKHGRPVYRSALASLEVNGAGRWEVNSRGGMPARAVSAGPAERLEHVRLWQETSGNLQPIDNIDLRVECLPLNGSCRFGPCTNNGTCINDPDSASNYFCRCPFDSVSPNCQAVRECKSPPRVANGNLLFTTDLSPHGKAFYSCEVGYVLQEADRSPSSSQTTTFAICDGSSWQNLPRCVVFKEDVNITAAYVHFCNFYLDWCRYTYGARLSAGGVTLPWRRDFEPNHQWIAEVDMSGFRPGQTRLAKLETTCMFVPDEGCVAFDFIMSSAGETQLVVMDTDGVTLWKTTQNTTWTTATLTLPPGGNRLTFEVLVKEQKTKVALDNIRVFQWNCRQVGKLLFGTGGARAVRETVLPLVSLVVLLLYTQVSGFLGA